MPSSCPVCGSADFDCDSGLYFCSGCGTQSQQFVVEECERDYEAHTTSVTGEKFDGTRQDKDTEDKQDESTSRPWDVTEGLTILLRHQVAALIKMGAAPELKDVVFKLWASYLKKIGKGFGNLTQKTVSTFVRADFVPTFDQPKPASILLVNQQLKKKQSHSIDDLQAMRKTFGGETFYDPEDDPFSLQKHELDELDMYAEEREQWLKKLKSEQKVSEVAYCRTQKYHGQIIVLHVTMSLCYIALQYTNSFVTLFDILKAVKAGLMPFGDGPDLFPSNMKLVGKDWLYFCTPCTPSMPLFYRTTKSISSLLGVLPLPVPDMKLFTLRYLQDMNLPVGLHGLIRSLLMRREPRLEKPDRGLLPKSELLAVAYVIVAVKLVFGLNDDMEERASAFTREVAKLLDPTSGMKLFDWSDWVVEDCRRRSFSSVLPNHWKDVRTSVDTDSYCRAFSKYCSLKSDKYKEQANAPENSNNITGIFKQMRSQLDSIGNCSANDQSPSAPPSDCDSVQDMFDGMASQNDSCRQDIGERPQADINKSHVNDLGSETHQDYTQHLVMHLTDWENFVDLVIRRSTSDQSSDQATAASSRCEDVVDETLHSCLEEVSKRTIHAWTDYVFYKFPCDLKHCHKSYIHLLEAAELCIGYNKNVIHTSVQSLELVYISGEDKQLRSELSKAASFIHLYF
ncbi:hypothetical protein LSH36_98g05030 [Paralvinella palmiformis]|uniref:Rrn7/TAF1B C-terminal cyclin domain-containing protein n=1 Tax=Paralvinella palmiformis TaxID=53620 RepID=A0AAD9K083_9ANNE|nr:hypothetical protein LSH36_98g05030 [Paralvinella palmiformis]